MKKHQINAWVFIIPMLLLTGFRENTGHQIIPSNGSSGLTSNEDLPKISIADAITAKGEKGQKAIEVMVFLSKSTSNPVTVNYSTKNGTAKAGVDYMATSGSISFEPGERMKKISVFIIGEVAADPDEDAIPPVDLEFEINLNNAIGGLIEHAAAIITLIRNIFRDPRISGGTLSVYEVEINYVGYCTFSATPAECGIRSNGAVTLTGQLAGVENLRSDDDMIYRGTLQMFINIDVCSMDSKPNSDEGRLCSFTVYGSGKVFTELKIYYDTGYGLDASGNVVDSTIRYEGRGGYIQIENRDGRFRRTVEGDCEALQIDEEWKMVPNKTIASVFNGKELPMLVLRTLQPGTYTDTDDQGNITRVRVIRKIR